MHCLLGQALKAGAEADFQLPSVDTPDDIVAGRKRQFVSL